MNIHMDLQPLVVALAVLVPVITPALILRLQGTLGRVHGLVNGQLTALLAENAALKAQVTVLTAQAATAAALAKAPVIEAVHG